MSIKRTPICPFCKCEMKQDMDCRNGVAIPTEIRHIDDGLKGIVDLKHFDVWVCGDCGFVAFWRGEPR